MFGGVFMGAVDQELEEKIVKPVSGVVMLIVSFVLFLVSILLIVTGILFLEASEGDSKGIFLLYVGLVYLSISWLPFRGLKKLKSQEVLVLTSFGKYMGNLVGEGFFFVNPFAHAFGPVVADDISVKKEKQGGFNKIFRPKNVISLKDRTFNNMQIIEDELGNQVEVGIVVLWRVVNPARAVFAVENYPDYLSQKIENSLKDVFRLYTNDLPEGKTLPSCSHEISERLKVEIQKRVDLAGIGIIEVKVDFSV
jgi:regulator of protease activity HflC (stomatin/prohibitin superfamily)